MFAKNVFKKNETLSAWNRIYDFRSVQDFLLLVEIRYDSK